MNSNNSVINSSNPTPLIIQNGKLYKLTTSSNGTSQAQLVQQQTQIKTKKVIYKTTANDLNPQPTSKQPLVMTNVKQTQQPSIIVLQQQPQQQQQQSKTQKLCYIPVNTIANKNKPPQITQIQNKPINIQQQPQQSSVITSTTITQVKQRENTQVIVRKTNENHHQQQQSKVEVKQQNVKVDAPIQCEQQSDKSNILNEYLTPDARIFKAFLKTEQQTSNVGQLQYLNDILTYKVTKLGVNEHILLENPENLTNFSGDIEKLQAFAYILATKLNKPVTIPAYLNVNFNNLENIQNLLSQRNVKPLFEQNKNLQNLLEGNIAESTNTTSTTATITQEAARPPLKTNVSSSNPVMKIKNQNYSELRALLEANNVKTEVIQQQQLEPFSQLANGILNRNIQQQNTNTFDFI